MANILSLKKCAVQIYFLTVLSYSGLNISSAVEQLEKMDITGEQMNRFISSDQLCVFMAEVKTIKDEFGAHQTLVNVSAYAGEPADQLAVSFLGGVHINTQSRAWAYGRTPYYLRDGQKYVFIVKNMDGRKLSFVGLDNIISAFPIEDKKEAELHSLANRKAPAIQEFFLDITSDVFFNSTKGQYDTIVSKFIAAFEKHIISNPADVLVILGKPHEYSDNFIDGKSGKLSYYFFSNDLVEESTIEEGTRKRIYGISFYLSNGLITEIKPEIRVLTRVSGAVID